MFFRLGARYFLYFSTFPDDIEFVDMSDCHHAIAKNK